MTTKKVNGPKILELDIETAPHIVYAWGLFKQTIGINQIVKPGYTICWAAKWLHEDKVLFSSIYEDTPRQMIKKVFKLLEEADAVVHYNGKKFDIPTLNREFIKYGFGKPKPYQQIDLYHVIRSETKYASNKLDFVCQELGLGNKVEHKGMELWTGCMRKDKDSWKLMKEYNIQDVRLLEKLYRKILPWVKTNVNFSLYVDNLDRPVCPHCGHWRLQKRGTKKTKAHIYQQYQCQNKECMGWSREPKNMTPESTKEHRLNPHY